jgi:D-beta-D-heptose 7-phosphate kinase / D-beta-D-heptose 1-phosphate adenosyltransferase
MKTVLTNGCFDVLHVGHVRLIAECRRLAEGGAVIVGLNSDAGVRRLKGQARPIIPFAERREMLLAVGASVVAGFDTEAELLKLIALWRPGCVVRGRPHGKAGPQLSALLASWDGEFHFFEGANESTTDILRRAADCGDRRST